MKITKFTMIVVVAILLCSCSNKQYAEREVCSEIEMEEIALDEIAMKEMAYDGAANMDDPKYSPETYISSSAAVENPNDTTRKMIRTANIKFKVKDVIKSTYNIENIVVKHNGFVENTDLTSYINHTKETCIKEDSILVTTYYSVVNTLVLRVPNTKLDTTLKEIAKLVDFMDYRVINAKDVTLDLLSKKLEQNRLARYDRRMKNAIENKGKRLDDVTDAENNLLYKQEQADEARLVNLQILDKIKFSTITLSLYQNQSIRYEVIAKEKKIKQYSTPFGIRFVDALKFGWTIIVEICLFLVNIWSIILLAVLVFFGVKYFRKRGKKMVN